MRIIDPQSALLTAPEVLHSLRRHQARQQTLLSRLRDGDKLPKGSSALAPEMAGYRTVLKSLNDSFTSLTPRILTTPPPEYWLHDLLSRLVQWDLTQAECLMVVDLGVGLSSPATTATASGTEAVGQEESRERGWERDGDEGEDEDEKGRGDEGLLGSIIEEMEERLQPEEVQELLRTVREVVEDGRRKWEVERQRVEEDKGKGDGQG